MDREKHQSTEDDRRLATTIISLKDSGNKQIINAVIDDLLLQQKEASPKSPDD